MTLEESILFYEEQAKKCNNKVNQIILGAERCERDKQEYTQLAEWLKILKKAKFEYDEACAIFGDGWDSPFQYEDKEGTIVGCYLDKHYIDKADAERDEYYASMAQHFIDDDHFVEPFC